jgi:hypothetical protein
VDRGTGPADVGAGPADILVRDLPHFLAVAEKLRTFGETHRPLGGRKNSRAVGIATLDAEAMWKAPPDLCLPAVEVKFRKPTEWTISRLREYKAER